MTVYDFDTQLKQSEAPRQYIRYMTAIDHWWGDEIDDWNRVQDLLEQKKGNDMTITLSSGQTVNLQFKTRQKDYDDILIEYRHDFDAGYSKPGWIELPSKADYLIVCMPSTIYRINYPQLKKYWERNKEWLISGYSLPPVRNRSGYWTYNAYVGMNALRYSPIRVQVDQLAISKYR